MYRLIFVWSFFSVITNALFAERYQKKIVEIQPMFFSAIALLLYVLAYFNRIWFIDYVAILGTFLYIVTFLCLKEKDKIINSIWKLICDPTFIIFLFVVFVGMWAVSQKAVFAGDELNFWAPDIKSIFYLQGYADKGFNCRAGYGDYPPIPQLLMAFVMHVFGKYDEGIMMSGYFLMIYIYVCPIISKIPRNIMVYIASVFWLFTIFSFGTDMFSWRIIDIFMGVVYGCILYTIITENDRTPFLVSKISLMMGVLILTKSIGFQWVIFASVFWIAYQYDWKFNKQYLSGLLVPTLSYLSWFIFCKVNNRTTYLVQNLDRTIKGENNTLIHSQTIELVKGWGQSLFMGLQDKALWGGY